MEGPGPDKDVFNIHLNSALQHIKLAKTHESVEKYEAAYKHYLEASYKLRDILRQEPAEDRKKVFMRHFNECVSSAGFLKSLI